MEEIYSHILKIISENRFVSAKNLAIECRCSDKTIRTRIREINDNLKGAKIISKPRYGYCLEIIDENLYNQSIKQINDLYKLPNNSKERVEFLLRLLLLSNQYYKRDDLSDILYISSKTLSHDIQKLEQIIKKYDLRIERRPNYGIKVIGSEFNFRLCLSSLMFQNENDGEIADQLNLISKILTEIFEKYHFKMSDIALQNLINHIYISMNRIKQGWTIVPKGISLRKMNIDIEKEYIMAKEICIILKERTDCIFPECEVEYIAIHLAGKKMWTDSENFVVTQEIMKLTGNILNRVYEKFHIDFRHNLELKLGLCKHLVPMKFRINLNMNMRNPLLNKIKENYLYAYTIGEYACSIISSYYGKSIEDDEIGYIALHFALAIEQEQTFVTKKNILIVCASGLGTSQFLLYKYKEEFGKYIDKIEACGERELNKIDIQHFDYIFSTVPILSKVDIPIIQIDYFLNKNDIQTISKILTNENQHMYKYYSKELFIVNLNCKDRKEIIKEMCHTISLYEDIPQTFEKSILEREAITSTEFGNHVALTHPLEPLSQRTFACVAVLKDAIIWKEKEIKVVFLISIEQKKNKNIQDFYKMTSKLLMSEKYMNQFIKNPTFEDLMTILSTIEREYGENNAK